MFRQKDGQPLHFYITHSGTKKALAQLIEENQGFVHKQAIKGAIVIIGDPEHAPPLSDDIVAYHPNFVHHSLLKGEMQDLAAYRMPTKTKHTPGSKRFKYSEEDDKVIVAFLKMHPSMKPTGTMIWKRMEQDKILPGHSWQSLMDRYLKRILPSIQASEALAMTTPQSSAGGSKKKKMLQKPITPPVKFKNLKPPTAAEKEQEEEEEEEEDEIEEEGEEGEAEANEMEEQEGREEEEDDEEEVEYPAATASTNGKDEGEDEGEDEEEGEDEDGEEEGVKKLDESVTGTPPSTTKQRPDTERWSKSRKNKRRKSSRVLFPSDDSQSQQEEGGGGIKRVAKRRRDQLLPSSTTTTTTTSTTIVAPAKASPAKGPSNKKAKIAIATTEEEKKKRLVKRKKSVRPNSQEEEEEEQEIDENENEKEKGKEKENGEREAEGEEDEQEDSMLERRRRFVRHLAMDSNKTQEEVLAALYSLSGDVDAARDLLVYNSDKNKPWTAKDDKALLSHSSKEISRLVKERGLSAVTARLHFLNN